MATVHAIVRVNGKAVKAAKFTAPTFGTARYNANLWAEMQARQHKGGTWQVRNVNEG